MKMMKNISKNKKALLFGTAVCTAACIFTAPVSALASPEFARSAEEWARLRDNKLEWDEIDGLVNEYNSVVINNNIDLQDNAGKDAEEIRNDLLDAAADMDDMASEADSEDGGSMTAATYRMQAEQLRQSADSNVSDVEVLSLQYKAVEASVADSVRNYFISYHTAIVQKEYDSKQAEIARLAYDTAVNQFNVGMATELDVLSAKEAMQSAEATLISDDSDIASAKRNMMVLCGWKYESDPEIGEMPEFDIEASDDMNVDEDIEKALENNYNYRADQRKLDNAPSVTIREQYEETVKNDREQIAADIKSKAASVRLAKSTYDQALANLDNQKRDLESKRLQASLGTISQKEFSNAELTVSSLENDLKLKEYALFSALTAYNSAVSGTASTGAAA